MLGKSSFFAEREQLWTEGWLLALRSQQLACPSTPERHTICAATHSSAVKIQHTATLYQQFTPPQNQTANPLRTMRTGNMSKTLQWLAHNLFHLIPSPHFHLVVRRKSSDINVLPVTFVLLYARELKVLQPPVGKRCCCLLHCLHKNCISAVALP